jgi:adenosylmethionine---8-amino-7-oxononanoate aminotransferase
MNSHPNQPERSFSLDDHTSLPSETIEHWRALDRSVVWHAFSQMSDYDGLIIESAKGCWLSSIDGKRYFDGASSMWCNVHGHSHPYINQAIATQLSRVAHVTNLGMSHPITLTLAQRLVSIAPDGLEHVFFSGDGASAVEVAMKMAFQFWRQCPRPELQRTKFIALGNAYHGDTIGTVSVGGVSRFHSMFQPLLFPVLRGPCPDVYRLPEHVDPADASPFYLAEYRKILSEHAGEIVAMIIEPIVQGAAGVIIHPPGFLSGIEALCREFGCLLIADEVAVGLGRTGTMYASEHEQCKPDFLCLGKGLTGGYLPMSATLTTDAIWDAFLGRYEDSRTFFHGHTFGGNPLGAAAACASLELFEAEQTLGSMPNKTRLMQQRLSRLIEHPEVGDVRVCGMIGAIELVVDKKTKVAHPWEERRAGKLCDELLKQSVWLRPLGNVVPIIPPLCASTEELDFMFDAIEACLFSK